MFVRALLQILAPLEFDLVRADRGEERSARGVAESLSRNLSLELVVIEVVSLIDCCADLMDGVTVSNGPEGGKSMQAQSIGVRLRVGEVVDSIAS